MSALKICPQCGTEYELDQSFCPKDGSTLRSQSAGGDLVGSIVADRYRVTKKLGEGGMGTVYLAEHVKMGRKSAIKVMNPGMVSDADAISRFNREASNASRINHPNVAAVYDFGETKDGLIYLAMEFIEGPSLTSVIEQSGSLSAPRAAEITRQAGEALSVAHDMGIVHRDLKPDNIMLAKGRDGSDVVKIVDFGIAKAAEVENQKVTKTGLVVGTPEYMSPEQLAGDKLDGRSDTYSLALVSFAMMTGKLPFPAETIQESMIKRLTDEPKPLAEMKADTPWPAEVQAVMDKALQRDVTTRYQTASEFGRALHQAVQAMPRGRASAATAVLESVAKPAAGDTAPRPVAGGKTVPQTRVNPATPHTPPHAVPAPAAKSSMPKILGGIGVVAALGIAGFLAMNKGSGATDANENFSKQTTPTQSAAPAGEPAAAPALPPSTVVARALADRPDDSTAAMARETLIALAPLDSLARLADDSTFLSYRFTRARAMIGSGDARSGCDTLKKLEGQLAASRRYKRSAEFLRTSQCQ